MIELATGVVNIIPSTRGIKGNLEKAFSPAGAIGEQAGEKASRGFLTRLAPGLSNVGGMMQKTGMVASVALTAPIVAGFSKAMGAASGLNESVNAVNVVFGKAAGTIHSFARTAAQDAGLSMQAFNELVTPIGAGLQNMGFGADEAAKSSVNLASRAADMASVFNVDVSEALGAIQAGLRGEADPLERFGVGLSDAAVTAHALEMGLGGTADELDANAKTQARLSLLMKQTDAIAGDFANTSTEVANAERIAAAEAANLAADFGQKLLPAKAMMIQVGSNLLDRFNGLSPSMQNTALATAGVAAAAGPAAIVLGTLLKATSGIITHGPKVVGGFAKVAGGMFRLGVAAGKAAARVAAATASMIASAVRATARVVASIAVQVARWAWMGVQALFHAAKVAAAWLIALGPIGLVIAAVVGLVALIVANWDRIKRVISAGWRWVQTTTARLWNGIRNAVSNGVRWVVDSVRGLRDRVVGYFRNAGSWLWNAGENIVQGLINGIRNMIGAAGRAISDVVSNVTDYLPWSPAKKGPLRRRPPELGGANIVKGMAAGMTGNLSHLTMAADMAARAALPDLGATTMPAMASTARTVHAAAVEGRGGGVVIHAPIDARGATEGTAAQIQRALDNFAHELTDMLEAGVR